MVLFDKHERPILRDMPADEAWSACDSYEDYVYTVAQSVSEEEYDRLISDVDMLYDEYYRLFESEGCDG